MLSASANLPSNVTLGDTRLRSIEPRYRKLIPRTCAISSCVRPVSLRIRRKFVESTSLRSISNLITA